MKALRLFLFIILVTFMSNVTAQTVYTTKTGEKYHKNTCRYLKYSKKEIKLEVAISRGYEACKVCKPTATNIKQKTNTSSNTSSLSQVLLLKKLMLHNVQVKQNLEQGVNEKLKTQVVDVINIKE